MPLYSCIFLAADTQTVCLDTCMEKIGGVLVLTGSLLVWFILPFIFWRPIKWIQYFFCQSPLLDIIVYHTLECPESITDNNLLIFLHVATVVKSKPSTKQIQDLVIQGAAPSWRSIGIELLNDNDVRQITIINQDHPTDHQKCCQLMFDYWIKNYPQRTWQELLDALESQAVGLKSLAHEIKQSKY